MSVLLRLAYDGTDFAGFAAQPGQRTVQGEVEAALSRLLSTPGITVRGASRTDAGVHAHGQLVAFEKPVPIPPAGVLAGLTGALPRDLAAVAAWEEVAADGGPINPRFGNGGKRYRYDITIDSRGDPFRDRYAWRLERALDLERMRQAAAMMVGTHDFAAFRASDCQASTTTRTITRVDLQPSDAPTGSGQRVRIEVEGTAFLKRMVRVIAGTLVDVGYGRRSPESVRKALASGRRRDAGPTAPAHGLCLVEVLWPDAGPTGPTSSRARDASREAGAED